MCFKMELHLNLVTRQYFFFFSSSSYMSTRLQH